MTHLACHEISFTFILPLFPSLLAFYRSLDTDPDSLLNRILHYLNAYKQSFSIPINSQYDIVLLGGALGSLFSFLQAIASPVIGRASDRYGRRKALLWSMTGNMVSVALWCAATDFRTFLLSRVVGGLSEGNVQLATAIAADISEEGKDRSSTMALVGACFSIAFTFGPTLGAALANVKLVKANPFATAAGVSLFLITAEIVYLYLCLPETKPADSSPRTAAIERANDSMTSSTRNEKSHKAHQPSHTSSSSSSSSTSSQATSSYTNHPTLLNLTHLFFLLPFSGLEFSLPFLLSTILQSSPETDPSQQSNPSALSGRLLGFIGLIASILQGSIVRRLPSLLLVRIGLFTCALAFYLLSTPNLTLNAPTTIYIACALLATTSATVVTSLNSLTSAEGSAADRGKILGKLRSWGQLGRALGPLLFCTLFWWAGRQTAYLVGATCMFGLLGLTVVGLREPGGSSDSKKGK